MPDGTMNVRHTHHSLPGHEGYGTIEIVYNFSPGSYVSNIPFQALVFFIEFVVGERDVISLDSVFFNRRGVATEPMDSHEPVICPTLQKDRKLVISLVSRS